MLWSSNKTIDFPTFRVTRPPRRNLSVLYTFLYFNEKLNILNLSVLCTFSHVDCFFDAFWEAADLTVLYTIALGMGIADTFQKRGKCIILTQIRIRGAGAVPKKGRPGGGQISPYYSVLRHIQAQKGRLPREGRARRGFRLRTGKHLMRRILRG